MSKPEEAEAIFRGAFNCAQAVFTAFAPELGLERELALRVAGGFGGGIGRMGDVCGAVTGAVLVLGLKYGKYQPEDNAARDKTYALVQEFARQFRERHTHLACRDLLGCDISQPGGSEYARQNKLFDRCRDYVRDAVDIVEGMASEGR